MKRTYNIIEMTSEHGANELDSFDTEAECVDMFKALRDPGSLDCYFADLVEMGGYLRMEDSDGNEVNL
jgi:hypothetical protein